MVSRSSPPINFNVAIHKIVREEWGYLLSSLIKSLGDLHLAEDVLQDAVEAAIIHWRNHGLPNSPNGWLLTTAKRKAIDRFRRDNNFKNKQQDYTHLMQDDYEQKEHDYDIPDERLRLIFTCCHPALDPKVSVALTLQLLGGLTTLEIARAFFVKKEAMAQRLVRGKRKIKQAAIPYIIPEKVVFPERLDAVLKVLYLIFNEGYSASSGHKHIRIELCREAIRLAHILNHLCPNQPEIMALLALMLLHDSRANARFGKKGELVPLEGQDRAQWNRTQIEEGRLLVEAALKKGPIGTYQIQAAISAVHAEAENYHETNWQEIILLYDELYKISPSPVVKLNRLAAFSYVGDVEVALVSLKKLEIEFRCYQPYYATRADFYRRLGDIDGAKRNYQKAIELSGNKMEKDFLMRRLSIINSLQDR